MHRVPFRHYPSIAIHSRIIRAQKVRNGENQKMCQEFLAVIFDISEQEDHHPYSFYEAIKMSILQPLDLL